MKSKAHETKWPTQGLGQLGNWNCIRTLIQNPAQKGALVAAPRLEECVSTVFKIVITIQHVQIELNRAAQILV